MTNILIDIGILTPNVITRVGMTQRYYDTGADLLVLRKLVEPKIMLYQVFRAYNLPPAEGEQEYGQMGLLLTVYLTPDHTTIEHYDSGDWEKLLAKTAEAHQHGKNEELPKIRRIRKRPTKGDTGKTTK